MPLHERTICPHGMVISSCRCINASNHTKVIPCPCPGSHEGRPVTAGWSADGLTKINATQPVHPAAAEPAGVWMAFNSDGSAAVPFAEEIDAYRYAAPLGGMTVQFTPFGSDVFRAQS